MRDPVDYAPPARKQIAFLTPISPRSIFEHPSVEVAVDVDQLRCWRQAGYLALVDLRPEDRAAWAKGMARSLVDMIGETLKAQIAVDLQKELDTKFPCVT